MKIHKPIIIILLGWSWILKKEVVNNFYVIGIHPSDLPNYAGGSPIQNQIINGLSSSKCTLFKISKYVDKGPILGKTNLNLDGNIEKFSIQFTMLQCIYLKNFLINYQI